jgi:uncharacterized protein (TIGR03067 family)
MRQFVVALAVAALGGAASAQEKAKSDREALIGTWVVYEFHDDGGDKTGRLTGQAVNPKDKPDRLPRLVFTADECYIMRPSKTGWLREITPGLTNVGWKSCKLDETAKPAKTIDIVGHARNGKEPRYPGIYELDGKNLRICYNESPAQSKNARPTEYKSDGQMNLLICGKISDEPLKPDGDYVITPPKK